jgi:beta-glucosidase/6-phospho-beta-glucosidase/beta-galactosidase
MGASFLDEIRSDGHVERFAGGRYGGSGRADGAGLPRSTKWQFAFATGIECSSPTITGPDGRTLRRDMLEECGHYARYKEDFALVRDLGLRVVRYGLPYHKTHLGPGRYDWSFADAAMAELQRLELLPILDLLHFGLPDWLGDFQNPELPVHFAHYCGEVAKRYPWVRAYTPVNEIWVTAQKSAKEGAWNERLKDDPAFVTALKHLAAASITACAAIVQHRPDAIFITSETAEYIHDMSTRPGADIKLHNRLSYVSFDLLYGKQPEAPVYRYLRDNGMTEAEFDWFMQSEPAGHQIMGNDYYGRNERMRLPDGRIIEGEDVLGWYLITKRYYDRYYKPIFHTETNVFDADAAPSWLWKQWANVLRMRRDGVPVLGFTWYSLIDQIDWDIGLTEKRGTVNACGLYDLERKPRPVAAAYRMLIENFGQIGPIAHAAMFELTDENARLEVTV